MSKDIFPVVMPKLGMEMTEGEITQWHFNEGDDLTLGAELADIETDKLSIPYLVEFEGRLKSVVANVGVMYPVGKLLAVIAAEGVSDEEISEFVASYKSVAPKDMEASDTIGSGTSDSVAAESAASSDSNAAAGKTSAVSSESVRSFIDDSHLEISPIAARLAIAHAVALSDVQGTGRQGRITVADIVRDSGHPLGRQTNQLHASPAARRVAADANVALSHVQGTGPKGRILKKDVEEAVSAGATAAPATEAGAADFRSEPHSNMRKAIARRLVQSKTEAPHHYLRIELHMADLMKLRESLNSRPDNRKTSINDFLIRAVGMALREVPEANVQFTPDAMRYFDRADVGVAVAVDDGLITPVVHDACEKSVFQISEEVAELVAKARAGGLMPTDIEGGTITISNLGMFGIQSFDAVVNPPQGAIVAVGVVEERPANVDGRLALAPMMHLTLSCDHRAIDGAVGARYLAALKTLIENPNNLVR